MMNPHIENQTKNYSERVDLSDIVQDTTLSLHPHAEYNLEQSTLCAKIEVFNLTQVYATTTALLSIKRASQTVPFVIEQYAKNYTAKLFRAASRGNDKGLLIRPHRQHLRPSLERWQRTCGSRRNHRS